MELLINTRNAELCAETARSSAFFVGRAFFSNGKIREVKLFFCFTDFQF